MIIGGYLVVQGAPVEKSQKEMVTYLTKVVHDYFKLIKSFSNTFWLNQSDSIVHHFINKAISF